MTSTEKRRCEDIRDFMRKVQRRLSLRTQTEMARELGLPASTYKYKLHDPRRFSVGEMWIIETVAHRVGLKEEAKTIFNAM